MLTSSGTKSMELNIPPVPVSSSPSLNRTPALSVSSFSTDRSNDATPPNVQHQFFRSHIVEDDESCETGSMRYSPPSPSNLRELNFPIASLDDTRNVSIPGLEDSRNIAGAGQSLKHEDQDFSKTMRGRAESYPSPIGRGSSLKYASNRNSPLNQSLSSNKEESLNPFSQNLSFRRDNSTSDKLSTINSTYMNDNIDIAKNGSEHRSQDTINIHNDLANLSLRNRSSLSDYNKNYPSSQTQSIDIPKKESLLGTIGTSLQTEKALDKSSGIQPLNSQREFLSQDNNNLNLNRARTYSAPESSNPFLSNSKVSNWGEGGRNSLDDRVGITGSNFSTGKMTENRNIFPSMVGERSLIERSNLKGQSMNNHDSNINTMYNNNQNNVRPNHASLLDVSGNFNSLSEHSKEDSRKLGPNNSDSYNVNPNFNGQYQKSVQMNKANEGQTYLSRSISSGPRLEHGVMQGSLTRGSTGDIGRHGHGVPSESFDRMNRNPMMYIEGGNISGRTNNVNDMRRFMPQMHAAIPPQHPLYNDYHGAENINSQIHPQIRSQMQQQNQMNQHPFHQVPMHFQGRHQIPNGQRLSQSLNHLSQSGYNPNMGNDLHRSNLYLDEYQPPPTKAPHHPLQPGTTHMDHFQRGNLNSQQFHLNQENNSVRRGEGGLFSGSIGQMHMTNNSGLPPRHRDDYDNANTSRSKSMPHNRLSGIEGSLHHGSMSVHSQENSTHGSVKNPVLQHITPDVGISGHGSNLAVRNQMKGPYNGRDTIDMQHNQHHDYRNENSIPHYNRRHSPLEEPIMNANDGDPYSVGGKSRGSSRHETISGNAVSMHHISSSSPQNSRNMDTGNQRGMEKNTGMKGIPKHLNIPHGHVARGSFDSGSYDDGMSSASYRHKMMSGMPHPLSRPSSLQNSVRSSQGSESSTSMDNVPAIVSPYPRESQISNTSPSPMPRLVYNIKFKRTQRCFILGPRAPHDVKIGCYVKVEADRGEDLGFVVSRMPAEKYNTSGRSSFRMNSSNSAGNDSSCVGLSGGNAADLKQVIRLATHDEVNHLKVKKEEEDELLKICRTKVKTRGLPMTVCDAEYQFDRNKLTFFFEAEGRIDFRELVRDLFSIYKTRIWMQQLDKNSNGSVSANGAYSNSVGDGASNTAGGNSVSSIHN